MQIEQISLPALTSSAQLSQALLPLQNLNPDWVLVFAASAFFHQTQAVNQLIQSFPQAIISGCSTAGEIDRQGVNDQRLIITAVKLAGGQLCSASSTLHSMEDSFAAGARIGQQLMQPNLKALMVFGPGLAINGTALVEGISSQVGDKLAITGGLAGDGSAFKQTWTLNNTGASNNMIVAVGFIGEEIAFAHGSFGGWQAFGPVRKVTRCDGNVLYELDGEPALEIYKRYLGEHAKNLPASGLLFPFEMHNEHHETLGLIRTILAVDESQGSLTLAGSINPNGYLKLMHARTDSLIDGAEKAAEAAKQMLNIGGKSLAILVSCVGRKLVMGELVDEEVEAVSDVFGTTATLTGFYSYGEISPFAPGIACHLHNQTMTITWIGNH